MKLLNKFIVSLLIVLVSLGATGGIASAKTLKERDDEAKAKYQSAKQTYLNEVNAFKSTRQAFSNAKEKYKQAKSVQNKADYEQKAKEFVKRTVSAMINRLEALKNKAQNVRGISDADRNEILTEIDKDINWLKNEQSKLETAATPAQLKEEAKAIKDYWSTIKITSKKAIAEIWIARLNFVIEKSENFSAKLSAKITELKAAGKNTAQLETWLNDFNQKIAAAKQKRDAAKAKIQDISNVTVEQILKEVNQFVKDANNYIHQAHKNLVDIVREMKKMNVVPPEIESSISPEAPVQKNVDLPAPTE